MRRLPGPSLEGNPVLWREWHRSRPSRWLLLLILLVGGSTTIACAYGASTLWAEGLRWGPPNTPLMIGLFAMLIQIIFGLLMLSAVAPMSMSEERQRGSLDLLAATTLSTPAIVRGKWLGTLRHLPLVAFGPALVGVAMATASRTTPPPGAAWPSHGPRPGLLLLGAGLIVAAIFAHGALLASVGLALGTWLKRQGRAIALSVAFAVLVGGGWPILVGFTSRGSRRGSA